MFAEHLPAAHELQLLVSLQTPLASWQQASLALSVIGPFVAVSQGFSRADSG